MTREEFKEYLDMVVEKAFTEGMLYQEACGIIFKEDIISKEKAIEIAKANILGE